MASLINCLRITKSSWNLCLFIPLVVINKFAHAEKLIILSANGISPSRKKIYAIKIHFERSMIRDRRRDRILITARDYRPAKIDSMQYGIVSEFFDIEHFAKIWVDLK